MGEEFVIKSETLESKINQLLPSQGGYGASVDLSASSMIVPIVDLTESAEGSNLRQDLQTAMSHSSSTSFAVNNTTTTIINTTGYFKIFGQISLAGAATESFTSFILNDGSTDKIIYKITSNNITTGQFCGNAFSFIVFCKAGDSVKVQCNNATSNCIGASRQVADIDGNLVNP